MTGKRKRGEGVPPLRNDDVTGMTEPKQDAVIHESGTTPHRRDAAREFLDEQQDQAQETMPAAERRGTNGESGQSGPRTSHPGLVDREEETELDKHWDPGSTGKRR
jgi:hypothetical protein